MSNDGTEGEAAAHNEMIIHILLFEHIFSYLIGIFRDWEIANYGKTDVNGIKRAPKETIFQTIEIFVDCILFGWTIYHIK